MDRRRRSGWCVQARPRPTSKRGQVSARPSVRAVGHPLARRSELVNSPILKVSTTHQVRREQGEVKTRQGARGSRRTREDRGEVSKARTPRGVCQRDRNWPTKRRGQSSAGRGAHPHTAHPCGRLYVGRRCTDQYPHPAGVQRTTHGAAEGGGDATSALLLALTTTGADPLRSTTPTSSTSSATACSTAATPVTSAPTATAAASASIAATDTSTPATTPTATPTPSAASIAASTAPASSSSAPAPLALARAASPARGRCRTHRLKPNEVGRSSRGNRGQKGGGGTPLKDGGARVTTRGSYSDYALLPC
ncbi:unnamed protein product [Closterium sp. NIES-64]|nr:unnamed protein product [Closterium sp. NIES-64]